MFRMMHTKHLQPSLLTFLFQHVDETGMRPEMVGMLLMLRHDHFTLNVLVRRIQTPTDLFFGPPFGETHCSTSLSLTIPVLVLVRALLRDGCTT
jgi:hypothetical protein